MSTALAGSRWWWWPQAFVTLAFALIAYGTVAGTLRIDGVVALLLLAAAIVGATRPALHWPGLVLGLLLVILFIPIRRYVLPGGLPFQLEPYRLYVMLLVGGWLLALLVDRRVSARRTGFEGPLVFLVAVTLASEFANPGRVGSLATPVLKSLSFFLSFVFVVYVLVSVIRGHAVVERMIRALVCGGGIISVAAVIEWRTGFNLFDHLDKFLPFLRSTGSVELARSGHDRVFGPAQHPIALGAALTMLVPLAAYLAATTRSRLWYFVGGLLVLGSLATLSRTSVVMLLVVLVCFLVLRPRATRRLWPLVIPLAVATHFVMPGTLGTFEAYFLPKGGIVQQQTQVNVVVNMSNPLWCNYAPRLARVGPMLHEASKSPIFGEGYGTRITDGPGANACVLDDQWLGTLLETGGAGLLAWWWLLIAFVRRTFRVARSDDSRRGWLLGAVGTSVASLGVGMFLFDTFSFIQVTFFLFIFLAFGAILLQEDEQEAVEPEALRSASVAREPWPLAPRPAGGET